jgi:outer membrane protein OmpA-like peptidoglycan-associated protein
MEAQFQSESRSVYAIQEARILQREAEGVKADEFATQQYTGANASLTRAAAHYDEGDYEAAYDIALRSMEEYRLAIETSQPNFLAEQDNILRDGQNQAIFEDAQRRFGAELAFIDARGIVVVVPGLFARGSSNKVDERIYLLDEILTILRSYDNRQILIEGHSQDRGSSENNMALSQTRSSEVQDYFLQRAISASRLSTAGFGEEAPRFDNRTDGGRADNDRVEIIFVVQ